MSMAVLLEQLQATAAAAGSSSSGVSLQPCIDGIQECVLSCFGGVDLDNIPASLLVSNCIAGVGERAQQYLNATGSVGQQGGVHTGTEAAECSAVMQEVEGLLQLAQQPVLLQLFGQHRVEELVEGLTSCKSRLWQAGIVAVFNT
jgi:hypothetical protein